MAAAAARARSGETVYVVLDGTTLTLTDRKENKELGRVGSPNRAARGIHVMNAFAIASVSVPRETQTSFVLMARRARLADQSSA